MRSLARSNVVGGGEIIDKKGNPHKGLKGHLISCPCHSLARVVIMPGVVLLCQSSHADGWLQASLFVSAR